MIALRIASFNCFGKTLKQPYDLVMIERKKDHLNCFVGFMRSLRDAGLAAALASSPKSPATTSQTSVTSAPKSTADNVPSTSTISNTVNSTPSTVAVTSAQVRATAETSLPGNSSEGLFLLASCT